MTKYLVMSAVILSLAPAVAFAGEGNGPDYPGMEIPRVETGSDGVITTISHRSDSGYNPSASFPTAVTPFGVMAVNKHSQPKVAMNTTPQN